MTKEESAKIMREWMALGAKIDTKGKLVLNLIDYANGILFECRELSNRTVEYLNAASDSKLVAPIPAFRGANPSPEAANKAVESIVEMMKEADLLLRGITAYRTEYNSYCDKLIAYRKGVIERLQNIGANPDWEKITEGAEELAAFEVMVDRMLALIPDYELRLKSVKRQLNIIKEVN